MLKPISFNWQGSNSREVKLGLVAQDVKKIIKEVVHFGDDEMETLGINYAEHVTVLIGRIQEQQSELNKL